MPFNRNQQVDPTVEETSMRLYIADQRSPTPGEIRAQVITGDFVHDVPASDIFPPPRRPTNGDFVVARTKALVGKGFTET